LRDRETRGQAQATGQTRRIQREGKLIGKVHGWDTQMFK